MFLDAAGRCDGKNREFKAVLDDFRRVWTLRRVVHNRRVQVRFLSHLPHKR